APAVKDRSPSGGATKSAGSAERATVIVTRPMTRLMGARIRRVRKRRQAAATRSSGRSAAASPNDWKSAAATFAPRRPVQLRAPDTLAETHDGSFGLYETRHSAVRSPTA